MLDGISGATNIYIITGYTDMRKSLDGLCAIVLEQLREEPNQNSIYLFMASVVIGSRFYYDIVAVLHDIIKIFLY